MTTAESVLKDIASLSESAAAIGALAGKMNVHDASKVAALNAKAQEYARFFSGKYAATEEIVVEDQKAVVEVAPVVPAAPVAKRKK